MLQSFLSRSALIFLSTTLVVSAVACREDKQNAATVQKLQPEPMASSVAVSPIPTAEPVTTPELESIKISELEPSAFELGLDKAASAASISQSAQSVEDWDLVASQYEDAIALMKQVKRQSPDFASAQSKIREYQRLFKTAQQLASPPISSAPEVKPEQVVVSVPPSLSPQITQPPPTIIVEENIQPLPVAPSPPPTKQQAFVAPSPKPNEPVVFVAPIKRRIGGTPVVEVNFNGTQRFEMILDTGASGTVITQEIANTLGIVPVGKAKANTASAKGVEFSIGYVDSLEVGGVIARKLGVAIAGSELEIGLLGHDFFGNYDLTIKRNIVEFRPSSHSQQLNSSETGLSVPISTKQHRFEGLP